MSDIKKSGRFQEYAVFTPWSVLLWVMTFVVIAVLYFSSMYMGSLNQDEGWYLYAARLVAEGQVPYRDFLFTQGPVMPYVYSLAHCMVEKWGVLGGRLFTTILGLVTMFCSGLLAYRLSAPSRKSAIANRQVCAALLTVILIGVNAYQAYFMTVVKTYSLTSLLLVLGFLVLSFSERRMGWLWAAISGVLFALGAGVRTSVGIIIPVVSVCLLWCAYHTAKVKREDYDTGDAKKEKVIPDHILGSMLPFGRLSVSIGFIAGAGFGLLAIFVPFYLAAPEGFAYGLFDYHVGRDVGGLLSMLIFKAGSVMRLLAAYFVAFSILVMICLYVVFHSKTLYPARAPRSLWVLTLVALSVLGVAILQILPAFPYDDYQVNIFPLFAVALAVYVSWVMSSELMHICVAVFFLSVAAVVSSSQLTSWFTLEQDRLWVRMRERPQIEVLRSVGRNIKDLSGDSSEILTQDTYIAVESGLAVPHGLELGPFSYVPGWGREQAENCNVVNREMLVEIIENSKAPVAAVSGYGFSVETPSVAELPDLEKYFLINTLEKRYGLFREIEPFGQADTKLKIYVRGR